MESSNTKSFLFLFVSALWLLSITAPPVIQLLDENSTLFSYTLNEEESKEQEKQDNAEEVILSPSQKLRNLFLPQYSSNRGWRSTPAFSTLYMEIKLPPPEGEA